MAVAVLLLAASRTMVQYADAKCIAPEGGVMAEPTNANDPTPSTLYQKVKALTERAATETEPYGKLAKHIWDIGKLWVLIVGAVATAVVVLSPHWLTVIPFVFGQIPSLPVYLTSALVKKRWRGVAWIQHIVLFLSAFAPFFALGGLLLMLEGYRRIWLPDAHIMDAVNLLMCGMAALVGSLMSSRIFTDVTHGPTTVGHYLTDHRTTLAVLCVIRALEADTSEAEVTSRRKLLDLARELLLEQMDGLQTKLETYLPADAAKHLPAFKLAFKDVIGGQPPLPS
jgi:hypothetical protein